MKTWISLFLLLGFLGCSKNPSTFIPAISTPLISSVVLDDAANWVKVDPVNRYFVLVADTHSMEPFFTDKSVPLMVKYTGQKIVNGTVVDYNRGDLPHVFHVVTDQMDGSVYMAGYNTHNSDGWFKYSAINGIVVGQLYLP